MAILIALIVCWMMITMIALTLAMVISIIQLITRSERIRVFGLKYIEVIQGILLFQYLWTNEPEAEEKPLKTTGKIWNADNLRGWGNRLTVRTPIELDGCVDIDGNLTPLPKVGDQINATFIEPNSGSRILYKFIIIEMKPCRDPADLFFGKAKYQSHLTIKTDDSGNATSVH
jgi:hypothetical protein